MFQDGIVEEQSSRWRHRYRFCMQAWIAVTRTGRLKGPELSSAGLFLPSPRILAFASSSQMSKHVPLLSHSTTYTRMRYSRHY